MKHKDGKNEPLWVLIINVNVVHFTSEQGNQEL